MADTRGVFGLKIARILKSRGEWTPLDNVWHSPSLGPSPNAGFVAGGKAAGNATKSSMEKLDFTSDTASAITSQLSSARYFVGSAGNSDAGYHLGGFPQGGPSVSIVDKTNYSTDANARVPGADLTSEKHKIVGSSSETALYAVGGSPGNLSSVQKLTYSTETTALLPSSSNKGSSARSFNATGNQTHGYFGGGTPSLSLQRVDKFTYSSETFTNLPGASLTAGRYSSAATGNSTQGYFSGGSPGQQSSTDKITYATETEARAPGADLSQGRDLLKGTSSSTHGYMVGGTSPSIVYSIVDKLDYSADTAARVPGANLNTARRSHSAISPREFAFPSGPVSIPSAPAVRFSDGAAATPNAGYFAGGNPGPTSKIDKLDFSTETTANLPGANLSAGRKYFGAAGGTTQGYFAGGHQPPIHSRTDKLTYSTDTAAYTPSANLHIARRDVAGTGNLVAGYFVGGEQPSPGTGQSYVDKCIYATDVTARIPGCNIGSPYPSSVTTDTAKQKQGCGNKDVSFFNGGPGERSFADKITYSSDTAATTPSAFLVIGRVGHGAAGNSDAGYFAAGLSNNPLFESRVEKTTYSNDTTTAVPSANLNSDNWNIAGTSNGTAAYFGSGSNAYEMNKMTFATETTALSPGAKQSESRYGYGAVSSRMNGFSGQNPPAPTPTPSTVSPGPETGYYHGGKDGSFSDTSAVQKISYATDTSENLPSTLTVTVKNQAGTSSNTAGYTGGGNPGDRSSVEKITYATDGIARIPGANLTVARDGIAACESSSAGYFASGENPSDGYLTQVDKLTFASDTTARIPSADLDDGRARFAAMGNKSAGYFGGGYGPSIGNATAVEKMVYSSETTGRIPGANLSVGRQTLAATGNTTAGYFGGGTPGPFLSTVDKLTYSTDTTARVPGADLVTGRRSLAATGSLSAGYFSGGETPSVSSSIDKLSYATETSEIISANIGAARYHHGASSSQRSGAFTTIV